MRTGFKGYRLHTSCKKHTGTGSSLPKRARCSGVVGSSSLPLQASFLSLSLSLSLSLYTSYIERERVRELDPTTSEQRALLGELDPVPVCFLQLVSKPLKAVPTLEKEFEKKSKKRGVEKEENYFFQTERTYEHKALSRTDSILCARCKSILWEAPEKRRINQRRDSSKRIEPGKVQFCF